MNVNVGVMIIDDHPAVREGLALRISQQADMHVCGETCSGAEALQLLERTEVDVAVVDIRLGRENGLELIPRLLQRDPQVRVLAWSMHSDALYALRALEAGALGYIGNQQATSRIVEAIRQVARGKIYVVEEVAQRLLEREIGRPGHAALSPLESLSPRELEVFRLVGGGLTSADIGSQLGLSTHTVDTFKHRIKRKLGLRSGNELNRVAILWGLGNDRPA